MGLRGHYHCTVLASRLMVENRQVRIFFGCILTVLISCPLSGTTLVLIVCPTVTFLPPSLAVPHAIYFTTNPALTLSLVLTLTVKVSRV